MVNVLTMSTCSIINTSAWIKKVKSNSNQRFFWTIISNNESALSVPVLFRTVKNWRSHKRHTLTVNCEGLKWWSDFNFNRVGKTLHSRLFFSKNEIEKCQIFGVSSFWNTNRRENNESRCITVLIKLCYMTEDFSMHNENCETGNFWFLLRTVIQIATMCLKFIYVYEHTTINKGQN